MESSSKTTDAFRPLVFSARVKLSYHRRGDWTGKYHMWHRFKSQISKFRIGAQLHYLGSHAPDPIRKKWRIVEKRFMNRYKKSY